MDSKVVQGAAAGLLVALTLAALAWGLSLLVGTAAQVNYMIVNAGVATFSGRLVVFVLSVMIVAGLAAGGYFLFKSRLMPEQESSDD